MNMTKVIITAVVLLVIGGGIYFVSKSSDTSVVLDKTTMEGKETSGSMEKEEGSTMKDYAGKVLAGKSSPLLDFQKQDYEQALKSDKLVVLYFYANWCPICKEEVPKLKSAFNELSSDKVIGFRINYNDSDTDSDEVVLAKEFGVAYQHTKVFLKNGKRVLKSPESWGKERYLEEINKNI